jgi:drug/metabolite transporter (DMT)-like permease
MLGSGSVFISAAIWGLFWIPMRHFHEAGLDTMWGVAAIHLAAALIAIPLAWYRADYRRQDLGWLLVIGSGMGLANVFYFSGLILSDVVRVTFLFYLLPIWATLFSRLFFNESMGPARGIALVVALAGLWLLLGGGGWPLPRSLGDVFGILAGMTWAFALTLIRGKGEVGSFSTTAFNHVFALLFAIAMGFVLHNLVPDVQGPAPSAQTVGNEFLPVLAFGTLILWTTTLGQIWGAKFIAATSAALLTMSEILVAVVSATTIGGESLPLAGWLGAGLIMVAVLVDLWGENNG